jgi:radical SAM protein with 4Fe4S-binding SPASM domain
MVDSENIDIKKTPMSVSWEVTQARSHSCKHCRIEGTVPEDSKQLSTAEGKELIDELVEINTPWLILSGGDPLSREDIFELVEYAADKGRKVTVKFSSVSNLNEENLEKLKKAGCRCVDFPLDGPGADLHDNLRGEEGSFEAVLEGARAAGRIGLPLKITSVLSNNNHHLLAELMLVVDVLNPEMWETFFLVPGGDVEKFRLPTTYEIRHLFLQIYELSKEVDFEVRVTQAPTYRRYSIERRLWEKGINPGEKFKRGMCLTKEDILKKIPEDHGLRISEWEMGAGRGKIFITAIGEVYADPFLPISCGNIRNKSILDMYQNSSLMEKLKKTDEYKSRCVKNGCWARHICGGSRARAYTYTGEPLGTDPLCFYADLV